MSGEALVVNAFLIARVFLVGGIFYVYPRISRKGLLFGTYVGEATAEEAAARDLVRSWSLGCGMVMALALLVGLGISAAGWPVTGNLTGTAVLLLAVPVLYLVMYRRARGLAPPSVARQAQRSSASLVVHESRGEGFAKFALAVCVLVSLGTIVYAMMQYDALPDRIATAFSLLRSTDELPEKSLAAILFVPTVGLVMSSGFALFAVLTAGAKSSVRGGSGGRSVEAQGEFRVVMSQTFAGMALFTCLLLTLVSVQVIRMALSETQSLGVGLLWAAFAMIAFALGSLIRIMRGPGQGGALLEEGSTEAPLTGGLADNAHWTLGVIYVDKEDPSMMVESRFGIGYTLNFGNPSAVLLMATYFGLIVGLVALAMTGAVA